MKITSYLKNLQIRYFALFSLACFAASLAEIPGLSLLLIGIWMQVANVLNLRGRILTKDSQIFYLKYFFSCIPLIIIIGSVNGFFPVFWKNFDVLKLISINIIQLIGAFLICLFMVFNFSIDQGERLVSAMILKILTNLKNNVSTIVHITLIFWGLNFVTLILSGNEYFFVVNFAIIHLYWIHWTQKMPVVVDPD